VTLHSLIPALARSLHVITLLLFWLMPAWIAVSSLFTFMAGFFLVPLYVPVWVILRWFCRVLLESEDLPNNLVPILEKSVLRNSRALRYNVILSIPAIFLFIGYLARRGAI
jgi:hypothetical protein